MKKQVFTKAWYYFKSLKISFSQALINAWKEVKKEIAFLKFTPDSSFESTSWKGIVTICYTKTMNDKTKFTSDCIKKLFEMAYNHQPINQSGAYAFYNKNNYNGD